MSNVGTYLQLVEAALYNVTAADIDAVEAFEAAHPEVVDGAYQAGLIRDPYVVL